MPDRIIKESITRSKTLADIDFLPEVCFYRLTVKADDFGRFYRDPALLKSELFPRGKKNDVTAKQIDSAFTELERVGLITCYEVNDDRYLQIVNWAKHQRTRATKSKYPDPDGNYSKRIVKKDAGNGNLTSNDSNMTANVSELTSNDSKCRQVADNRGKMSPNTNTNTKANTKTNTVENPIPPLADDETLISIQKNHDVLFDAAKKAGLPMTEGNMDGIVGLYGEYGLDAVLHGIREASDHNKVSVAYIRAVAKNYGNDKPEEDDWETELVKHLLV